MKKTIGWILAILGGFFCCVGVICIPVAFMAENVPLMERIFLLIAFVCFAVISGLICRKGFKLKSNRLAEEGTVEKETEEEPKKTSEKWMTSQYPALYLRDQDESYRERYINKLCTLGIKMEEAEKLFQFECDVIRKYEKKYLLDSAFTKNWFLGGKQPFFQVYPKTKEDILKEKSLTISELCKIIDEAEWHFWNSHEKKLSDAVWAEICDWRLKGPGMEYAISYFEMIAETIGVSMDSLAALSNEQGAHLNLHKWR